MLNKVRPNVVILSVLLAGMGSFIAFIAFNWLMAVLANDALGKTDVIPPVALLFSIVGGTVAAIGTALGIVAQDPPPPTVPAGTHENVVNQLLDGK